MQPILDKTSLKYTFSDAEITALAKDQARKFGDLREMEDEKKRVVQDFTARITSLEGEIGIITRQVGTGHEMRTTSVMTLKFRPTADEKIQIRLDTGHVIRRMKLPQDERQMTITDEDYTWAGEFHSDSDSPEDSIRLPLYASEAKLLEDSGMLIWMIDKGRAIEAAK